MFAAIERARDSFDPKAFEQPSFYARGAELSQLLQVTDKAQSAESTYRNSVQRTLAGNATLLTAAGRLSRGETGSSSVLVSDLHANVVVLDPLRGLFSDGPVFFAGDFGQRGTKAEADLIVPRLTALGHPLVAVSGNHDSTLMMRRLARAGARRADRARAPRATGASRGAGRPTHRGPPGRGSPRPARVARSRSFRSSARVLVR